MKGSKRTLAIGKNRMYAITGKQEYITHNPDEKIEVADRFYTRLYASDVLQGETTNSESLTSDVWLEIKRKYKEL